MPITALPPAPLPTDTPTEFNDKSFNLVAALNTFVTEANTLQTGVNASAAQVASTVGTIEAEVTAAANAAVAASTASASASAASAASSAGEASQSATLAQGSEQLAQQYASAAQWAANYSGDWSADRTYVKGQTVSYADYIFISKIDSSLNQVPSVATTAWFEIKTEADLFRQPQAISPTTGTSGALPNLTLQATAFAALYSIDTRIKRRFEVALSTDSTFTSPVFTAEVSADSVQVTPNLALTTAFIWRCKDIATTGDSAWMQANSFVTGNISIATPTLAVTGEPSAVPETPTLTTSAFATIPSGEDTHLSTDWEVRKASDNSLVWSSYNNTTNKLSIAVPAGVLLVATSYVFQARHNGANFGSSVYAIATATTVPSFFNLAGDIDGLVQLSTIQAVWSAGTTYTAGNIVIIRYGDTRFVEYKSLTSSNTGNNPTSSPTQWELVYDNNLATSGYFGEVLGSTCITDKGEWLAATAYSIGDMVVVKNIPVPKKQSDLTAYVSKTANTNKAPASNPSDWEQRNALPTGTALANSLGLSATGAVLQNNDTGWLKFVHQGKVKYIAKKSFMHTISWDDIAKAEAVYGNRTIRIGSNLFRVSILSGAEADPSSWVTTSTATDNKGAGSEWNELVYRVCSVIPTDGATTSHGGKQIGSNWKDFSEADLNITGNGGYVWCKETLNYNTTYRVLRGYSSLSYFSNTTSSHADAGFGWRPCLTLISEPEADSKLYNAEASGVGPSVASLQYDPITDTGFYGETTTTDLYTGTQISAATAVTQGTLQFDTDPWLKFYWHGQVLYIAKKPYRHTVSWDNINAANAVYGVNLGSTGRTRLTKGSMQLDVKLLKGATKDPSPASSPGRQWDELIYRVAAEVPVGQVGANWGSYTSADLQITGNGSYCWMQEVYQPNTSSRVLRGTSSLSYFVGNTSSTASASYGWRPCLALVR